MEDSEQWKDKYTGTQAVGCLLYGIIGVIVLFVIVIAIGWMASGA
jgi:hypothetical protein